MGHLDRRDSSVISSIDSSYCGARMRLFFGIGGQHAEDDRQAIVIGHPRNPAADLGADVREVGRLPADHGTETDDGVIAAATRPPRRHRGVLPTPRGGTPRAPAPTGSHLLPTRRTLSP